MFCQRINADYMQYQPQGLVFAWLSLCGHSMTWHSKEELCTEATQVKSTICQSDTVIMVNRPLQQDWPIWLYFAITITVMFYILILELPVWFDMMVWYSGDIDALLWVVE